jgi:hypothetical protein
MPNDKLLQVRNLKKYFDIKRGFFWGEPAKVHAVDGVTFDLLRGETLAGGGVGVRQVYHGPPDSASHRTDGGGDPVRTDADSPDE